MALKLKINDKEVTAEKGESLLNVARNNNIQIPSLCHHPALDAYGSCRLCLVEVTKDGRKKVTTSCNYEVQEGIEVLTDTDEIKKHRKMVLNLLLGMAPNSHRLQTLAKNEGLEKSSFKQVDPPGGRENCITCGLCARICSNVVGAYAITLADKGTEKKLTIPFDEEVSDACIGCGACSDVCHVDAIDMESKKVEQLSKLPGNERSCRYALMGLMNGAICGNNYECASCEVDQRFYEASYPEHPIFAARGIEL
ncbi:2Fe-2S iron-sulfur cluster-binding protein [Spirochaetota bacterium]